MDMKRISAVILAVLMGGIAGHGGGETSVVVESVSFVDESVDPSPSGSIVHVAWDFCDGSYRTGGPTP